MRVKFPFPTIYTKLSFFLTHSALEKKLNVKKNLVLVKDSGVRMQIPSGIYSIDLPAGESAKQWRELEMLLSHLAQKNVERSTTLVVVGGGAALDIGSLAASLYRRGMPLILVPTTLLAMVDATIGGKTAIDNGSGLALMKNFAGSFYPAQEVWINLDFLRTLPKRERISGAGEVWKTAWITGKKIDAEAIGAFVESGAIRSALLPTIKTCLEIKKKIVEKDPLDKKRIREVLNFGHTVGHALESLSQGELSHGEAVLWGMAVETTLLGKKGESMQKEIFAVIRDLQLKLPAVFQKNNFLQALMADKKKKAGQWEMSLLTRPGKIIRVKKTALELEASIKAFPEFFRRASSDQPA